MNHHSQFFLLFPKPFYLFLSCTFHTTERASIWFEFVSVGQWCFGLHKNKQTLLSKTRQLRLKFSKQWRRLFHKCKIFEKNSGFSFCQKWKSVAPLFSLHLSFRSLLNETIFIYRCHRPWNHLHWLLKSILKIFNSPLFHSPCVCFSFSFQNASLWITFGLCFICHSFTLFSYFETKKTINTKSPSMRYNCQP